MWAAAQVTYIYILYMQIYIAPKIAKTNLNLEIRQQHIRMQFVLSANAVIKDVNSAFSLQISARVKLLLNCCTVAAPQTQVPP